MVQGRVRILDDSVVNKIAAGEVVERPASVVKELVENSIDAEATRINISIVDGGISSITVTDNGIGMDREDAVLSLERHATSKIRSAEDIAEVRTLGFRGEALPSIAAVSRLELITRSSESSCGTRIVVEGGKTLSVSDHPSAVGTTVTVRDLFYNTPARRKYLKQPSTEVRRVIEVVAGEALAHPEVAFSLVCNDRRVVFTSGSGDLLQTLGELMGLEIAKSLVRFAAGNSDASVYGFISPSSVSRSNKRDLVLVVNGRPVSSSLLTAAVAKAYGPSLPAGRYPVGVVIVEIDPRKVDVNVHPAKTEVRFADEQSLFALITKAVGPAVGSSSMDRAADSRPPAAAAGASHRNAGDSAKTSQGWLFAADGPAIVHHGTCSALPSRKVQSEEDKPRITVDLGELVVIGQLWDSYIIAETPNSLLVIDQHAAMERLLYDDISRKLQSGGIDSQELLIPDTVILSASENAVVEENRELLAKLGFALEPFGMRVYLIRAVPAILESDDASEVLQEVLSTMRDESAAAGATSDALSQALVDGVSARLACRSALKANHKLSVEEMSELIRRLVSGASSLYCPHGRPIVATFPREEVERRVGRR